MSSSVEVIEQWVKANALPVDRAPGSSRVSISFDTVRAHLQGLPGNQLLIEARVCDLPSSQSAVERLVEKALTVSLGRLRDNPSVLTIDDVGSALWLQRRLAVSVSTERLDSAVEQLVNEVEIWRAVL